MKPLYRRPGFLRADLSHKQIHPVIRKFPDPRQILIPCPGTENRHPGHCGKSGNSHSCFHIFSAPSLKSGISGKKARSIACLYARRSSDPTDDFFTAITLSAEKEALKSNCIIKYSFTVQDIDSNPIAARAITETNADGIIVLGRCDPKTSVFLNQLFRNIIYVGLNPVSRRFDQVVCSGYAAGMDIMSAFYENGCRKIAYIGETENEVRFNAYRDFCLSHNLPLKSERIADVQIYSQSGYDGAKKMLQKTRDVDAIFCMSDVVAIGVLQAVQEAGIRIPEDIALLSVDDIPVAQFLTPRLSTISIPKEEMGRIAVKVLLDRIQNGHTEPLYIELPYKRIERGSFVTERI